MGLCHWPAAWSYTSQGSSIPPVHPGAQGDGGLHQGGSPTTVHSSFHHLQRPRASSSWARRTEASTTGPSMITLSSSLILFPWSRPPLRNSVGPASSRSWTCGAPITSFASGKATSGRRRSLSPQATMNIGSCRMAFPTPRPSSRGLWTRWSGSSSTGLSSCT